MPFALMALAAVAATLAAPRLHRATPHHPWYLLGAAGAMFLVGALLRPWSVERTGWQALLGDAFTVPGYLLMALSLAGLLLARSGIQRHALIDGLIVCVGAALATTLLLAMPAAAIDGRPQVVSVLAGLYPLFDVVLVLLLVSLAFTTTGRRPAYVLLLCGILLLLAGDLAYAIIGAAGHLTGGRIIDVPFLLSCTAIGAAALHPSVAGLSRAAAVPVQTWSARRLLVIVPAMVVPFALIPIVAHKGTVERIVLTAGGVAMVALLFARAVAAVRDYAAAQLRSEHQATHDPLTGLPNRLMLAREISRLLSTVPPAQTPSAEPAVWVLFLDLDGFKLVNDSWGHEAGDHLLVEVARRLRDTVPEPAMVARVGGDEFVVARLGTRQETVTLVERIMERLSAPVQVSSAEVVITPSIGVVGTTAGMAPVPAVAAVTAEALMRDADTAMYRAKSDGRGRWTEFDASMHERVRERVEIELALRQALATGQLHLAYQPIVELASGKLVGAEALIRWSDPVRGPISPAVFIPIAEDSGLIAAIGRWVLDETLRQVAAWRADELVGEDFWVSVNVSPRQLRDPTLPGKVSEALERWDVPQSSVVLEITESVMIDASTVTDQVLFDLRRLGVKMVVDDFGTGFSALGYLRRHPVTGVKIDRSFVDGLGTDAEDEEIVRAVVAMSTALKLTVVAEGVETPAQQDVLSALGVTVGQGHLWSVPVSAEEFTERWLVALAVVPESTQDAAGSS
ncbi:EAL domain-containing protein [Phytohabitans sp. ZYX-F-186]|uniref:EAL domain-containing protein n=1 Tax=Phytohabitans maris TaxID=3071409 RepID=A0ABU0ZV38_9ACTN|nr:EAL domain-containing protein [Phytohabitans sp. ZYX-F-186]MDQ7910903.1 EAL domain-containing protein [Phytohabitans sp. ZYX-F-186]